MELKKLPCTVGVAAEALDVLRGFPVPEPVPEPVPVESTGSTGTWAFSTVGLEGSVCFNGGVVEGSRACVAFDREESGDAGSGSKAPSLL